jgi:DNA-binding NtrC family response regulator
MAHVLVVHESETVRSDLARALMGEGFTVVEADSSSAAVREVWQGSFDAALIGDKMPQVSGTSLEDHVKNLAPEIVTLEIGKEPASKQARRLAVLLEGGEVAA